MATLRTTSPSSTNKNYINTAYGGYNRCINIKNGSVLPNCTGYCWGAWREMLGENPKLSTNNAERWIGMNTAYETGSVPKLGAVICYRGGSKVTPKGEDGAGHVAIVVGIGEGYELTVAQSNYGGKRFEVVTYSDYRYIQSNLHFQGFIYYPGDVEGGTDEGGDSDGDEGGTKKKTQRHIIRYINY